MPSFPVTINTLFCQADLSVYVAPRLHHTCFLFTSPSPFLCHPNSEKDRGIGLDFTAVPYWQKEEVRIKILHIAAFLYDGV